MKLNFIPQSSLFEVNPKLSFFFPEPSESIEAALFFYHPDSPIFSLPPEDKVDFLREQFPSLELESINEHAERINKYLLSIEERYLASWLRTLHERQAFFDSLPYDTQNVELKDAMLARTPKLWDDYEKIKTRLLDSDGKTMSGLAESISEQNLI